MENTQSSVRDSIVVVSGLPRSGTSMMMAMLQAGGVEVVTDEVRRADTDNPKGYYEFEPVKKLRQEPDRSWLDDAAGKVIKVISDLLKELPSSHRFKIIFLKRDLREVIASQNKMLLRRGEVAPGAAEDAKMLSLFQGHLERITAWIGQQPHFEVIFIEHREVVKNPLQQARKVEAFLDTKLNTDEMASVVDPDLYRNRA